MYKNMTMYKIVQKIESNLVILKIESIFIYLFVLISNPCFGWFFFKLYNFDEKNYFEIQYRSTNLNSCANFNELLDLFFENF